MLLKTLRARTIVASLAAVLFIFTGISAASSDCHAEGVVSNTGQSQVFQSAVLHDHNHSHSHVNQSTSKLKDEVPSVVSTLNNELCFVIGFVVFLLFKISKSNDERTTVSNFIKGTQLTNFKQDFIWRFNLTHLQLGIIRI